MAALNRALDSGAGLLIDPPYEGALEHTDYPPALFTLGNTDCLSKPRVAIVGSRQTSSYGKAAAKKFAESLARSGITIVSGGAFGIDTCAHEGALEVGGSTVSVLPTGVDVVYPAANRPLFQRIVEKGCLVSQFAMGQKITDDSFFLNRNQVIAALSDAILIVEAPTGSGSLKTALAAIEQGKEVFVVPGPVSSMSFNGSHNLIRDGATLVYHPGHILDAMGIEAVSAQAIDLPEEDSLAGKIYSALEGDPITAEEISTRIGIEASEILSELTMMEIDGLVLRHGIGYALKP